MKKKRKITIRFRLHSTAVGVVLILLILGTSIGYYINSMLKYSDVLKTIDYISQQELELRKAEKDFLLFEVTNTEFFQNKQSTFLDSINAKSDEMTELMIALRKDKLMQTMDVTRELNYLASYFRQYKGQMRQLTAEIYEKGFKDYGLIGKMRSEIHQLENMLYAQQNNKYIVHMLMLRRHEKDFLLRRDLKYLGKFSKEAVKFLTSLETDKPAGYQVLTAKLKTYSSLFEKVVSKDEIIGTIGNEGILQNLNFTVDKIEQTNLRLKEIVNENAGAKINEAFITLIFLTLAFSAIIVIILLRTTRYIIRSISHLQKYITRLGKGELPEKIASTKNDEITEMTDSINVLSSNLKNTRDFAIEVGQGNLRTQINVFNNKGDLGGALIEMRNQLEKVAKEQKKAAHERENRGWVNEGLANFSEILRINTESVEQLAQEVLKHLLTYVDALQGAIYIIDESSEELVFEQKAAIAINGRKVDKIKVYPGEDLLGRAVQLQKTIYIKKLPGDYMKVESALGYLPTQSLLILPMITYNKVMGILEIGSLKKFDDHVITFVERLAKEIARAALTVTANLKTQALLNETRAQAANLQERQEEILQQRAMLEKTNKNLQKEKEHTSQSIRYAQTIQNAILPDIQQINNAFDEFFLIYRPRDIVSGDYYWYSEIAASDRHPRRKIVAAIDCTGHGVPGAFMSLIGHSIMSNIVVELGTHDPAEILCQLNDRLTRLLKQNTTDGGNTDGMDMALCMIEEIDKQTRKVCFAGAKRPMYYFAKGSNKLITLKGDRRPIGGARKKLSGSFTSHDVILQKGSSLYLTTDGYTDQNNEEREKFGSRKFTNALTEVASLPMPKQQIILERALDMFQGNAPQRDDITVLGFRL